MVCHTDKLDIGKMKGKYGLQVTGWPRNQQPAENYPVAEHPYRAL